MVHQDHFGAGGTPSPLPAARHQVQPYAVGMQAMQAPLCKVHRRDSCICRRMGPSGAYPFPRMGPWEFRAAGHTRAPRQGMLQRSWLRAAVTSGKSGAST